MRLAILMLFFLAWQNCFVLAQEPYDCPGCDTVEVGPFSQDGTDSGDGCPCPDCLYTGCDYLSKNYVAHVEAVNDPDSEPFVIGGVPQSHWEPYRKIVYTCLCDQGAYLCTIVEEEVDVPECVLCPEFEEPNG